MFGGFLIWTHGKPRGSSSTEEEAQLFAAEQPRCGEVRAAGSSLGSCSTKPFLSKQALEQPCPCHHTSPQPHQQWGFSAGRGSLHGRACCVGKGLAPPAALILKRWVEKCPAFPCGVWLVSLHPQLGRAKGSLVGSLPAPRGSCLSSVSPS